ncbi:MAG: hypothetical protein QOG62_929 [Thermoleophilaceae bacterium]|jgi:hypothetical protein|nr:hypothetical protein [Thermoleophilaceae bacterium]
MGLIRLLTRPAGYPALSREIVQLKGLTMRNRVLTVVALGAALLAVAPATASAASNKTKYEPKLTEYKGTSAVGGLCLIQGVTCPSISNTNGAGYLRTSGNSLLGVLANATGTWTSPVFKYKGAAGDDAENIEFTMDRRANVTNLVEAEGDATYSVELVGGGKTFELVDNKTLTGAKNFTGIGADVPTSKLEDGTNYQIRIVTAYDTTVTVVGQFAFADYKDIALTAKAASGGGGSNQGGKNGKNGNRGKPGKDGRGAKNACKGKTPSAKDLRDMIKKGKNQKANVHGSRLRLKVSNKKHGVDCRVQVIGQAKGATKTDRVRVARNKTKTLSMQIKKSKAASLASAKKVKMKYKLKVEGRKAKVNDKVRVK